MMTRLSTSRWRHWLLLWGLVGAWLALWVPATQAAVVLDDHPRGLALAGTGQLFWRVDATGELDIDAVRDPASAAAFAVAPGAPRNSGNTQVHWFRIEVEQRGARGDWVLTTHTTALQDARFFGPYDSQGRALAPPVHTGLGQPFSTRPLGSERYLLRFELDQPGRYTLYARLRSDTSQDFGLSVWNTTEYLLWRQHKRLFDGLCYGILLALLIYNLVLTGVFRDASYGYYVGQCVFALLTLASFNGHAAHYLWGGWPWWQERANVVAPALWLFFGALFARSFLGTREFVPRLDRLLIATAALAVAGAALGLAGFIPAAQAFNETLSSAGALLAAVAAVAVVRQGFLPALWYLGGQALLFVSALTVVLINWGLVYAPFMLSNGLQLGVVAEMVVFAIALSSRIRGMRSNQLALRLRADHLAEVAATDPLTGLANRSGLAQGAARVLGDGGEHALMLLDLDRFKPVNDQHGHDAGDAVLKGVARRLQAHMRGGDIVARLGGDEFAILLAGRLSTERLAALAERLGQAVRQPVDFEGTPLSVGVSVGIARCPQDGQTLTELLRRADQAMYRAKEARSGHAFYGEGSPA